MREAERQGQRGKHGQGKVQVTVSMPESIANDFILLLLKFLVLKQKKHLIWK